MSDGLVTVRDACAIAGIDRDRFNEHAAAGRARFAPPTVPGRARMFTADDVAALVLFSDLLSAGIAPINAGAYATRARDAMRTGTKVLKITFAGGVAMSVDLDALRARA